MLWLVCSIELQPMVSIEATTVLQVWPDSFLHEDSPSCRDAHSIEPDGRTHAYNEMLSEERE